MPSAELVATLVAAILDTVVAPDVVAVLTAALVPPALELDAGAALVDPTAAVSDADVLAAPVDVPGAVVCVVASIEPDTVLLAAAAVCDALDVTLTPELTVDTAVLADDVAPDVGSPDDDACTSAELVAVEPAALVVITAVVATVVPSTALVAAAVLEATVVSPLDVAADVARVDAAPADVEIALVADCEAEPGADVATTLVDACEVPA